MKHEKLQVHVGNINTPNPSPPVLPSAPSVRNLGAAKRLLSRLIAAFCRGEVRGDDAKTLSFLLSTYCQIATGAEFEERLSILEKKIKSKS